MLTAEELLERFEFFDDWEDRYRYLIELGEKLPDMDISEKIETNRVSGCISNVWLTSNDVDGKIIFHGDSDAKIVKGLVAVVLTLFHDKTSSEIITIDAGEYLKKMQLKDFLTPSRSNGLFAMVKRINELALAGDNS